MRTAVTLLVCLLLSIAGGAQNLILNPSFGTGGSWTATGNFQYDARFTQGRSNPGYAYLSDFSGLPQSGLYGTLYQSFFVPANYTGISISFWYSIRTSEATFAIHDTCSVSLVDISTVPNIVYPLVRLTNLHANSVSGNTVYSPCILYLPNQPTGRLYKLIFSAGTDAQDPTIFRIDDVSAILNPTYSPNCISWVNNRHPSSIVDSAMNKLCVKGIISSTQDTNSLSGLISKTEIARYIGRAILGPDSTGVFAFMDYLPDLLEPGRQSILSVADRSYVKLMQYLEYSQAAGNTTITDNISPFSREAFFPSYGGSMLRSDVVKALLEAWNLTGNGFVNFYDPTSATPLPSVCDVTRSHKNCSYIQRATVLGLYAGIAASCSSGPGSIYYGTDNSITYREFFVLLSRMLPLYHKPIDYTDFFIPNQYYYNNLSTVDGIGKGAFQEYSGKGIQIPSGGPGLEFEFSYHSGLTEIPIFTADAALENTIGKAKQQPLGGSWTHTYSAFIKSLDPNGNRPSRILIYWPDGAVHSYLVQQAKYETKGITDSLVIDSFNALNQPAQIRIRRGRTVYTFRNIDKSLYCMLSLVSIADAHGNKVGLSYSNGFSPVPGFEPKLLTTVTDSFSMRSLQFAYDPATNYLKTVTDPAGRQLTFYVNPYFHDLDSSKDAKGQVTTYYADPSGGAYRSHLLIQIKRPKGNYINNTYAYRKLKQSGSPGRQVYVDRVLQYNSPLAEQSSHVQTIQNNQTLRSDYFFDKAGNLTIEASDVNNTQRIYDTATNRLMLERDLKLGLVRRYGYDAHGFLNKTVLWDSVFNDSIRYEYVNNSFGEVTLLKDYNDGYSETKFYRNSEGQPIDIVKNEGSLEIHHRFGYTNGLLTGYQDPTGLNYNYFYNAYGNIRTILKSPYTLGSAPMLTSRYSYDNLSRLLKYQDFVGDSVVYSYDNNDNLLSKTVDPGGLALTTRYTYDANDNVVAITSPKGHVTTLSYDFNTDDQLEENDGTNKKRWRYNQDGTLDSFVDKNGTIFKQIYYSNTLFPNNKLNGLLYSDGYKYFTYYDSNKNFHWLTYNGKTNLNWTERSRWNMPSLVGTENYFSNGVYDAVYYEYDQHQRPAVIAFQSFSSINTNPYHLSYVYDQSLAWLTGVYEDNRRKWYVKYDYQLDEQPTRELYGNGDTTFYHYDSYNRLDSMWAVNKHGQLLYAIGATLDANGRHTRENLMIVYQGGIDTTLPAFTTSTASYTYQTRNNPSCALRSDAFEGVSDDKEGCFQIESFGGDCMNAPWHSRLNA